MRKNKLISIILLTVLFIILLCSIYIVSNLRKTDESICVLSRNKDYHLVDADGDKNNDVLLLSFNKEDADISLSLNDNIINVSDILPQSIHPPFYILVTDITLDEHPEIILYDIRSNRKNVLYVYDQTFSEESLFQMDCDYIGFMDNGYTKTLSILDNHLSYTLNPLSQGQFVKSYFPALSAVVLEKNFCEFVDTALPDATYVGSYFSLNVGEDDYSFSPTTWHTIFKRGDDSLQECLITLDESSVSITKN